MVASGSAWGAAGVSAECMLEPGTEASAAASVGCWVVCDVEAGSSAAAQAFSTLIPESGQQPGLCTQIKAAVRHVSDPLVVLGWPLAT